MSYLEPVERKRSIAIPALRRDIQAHISAVRRGKTSFLLPFIIGLLIGGLAVGWYGNRLTKSGRVAATNQLPEGWVDEIPASGVITGWARDPDLLTKPVTIRVYFNGPEGVGTDSITAIADQYRPDWNAWAFSVAIPAAKRNGIRHSVHVYAVDVNNASGQLAAKLNVRDVTLKAMN